MKVFLFKVSGSSTIEIFLAVGEEAKERFLRALKDGVYATKWKEIPLKGARATLVAEAEIPTSIKSGKRDVELTYDHWGTWETRNIEVEYLRVMPRSSSTLMDYPYPEMDPEEAIWTRDWANEKLHHGPGHETVGIGYDIHCQHAFARAYSRR